MTCSNPGKPPCSGISFSDFALHLRYKMYLFGPFLTENQTFISEVQNKEKSLFLAINR